MSEQELKLKLAAMLPEKIEMYEQKHGLDPRWCFFWRDGMGRQIADESWLHVCWMIEKTLSVDEVEQYRDALASGFHPDPNYPIECCVEHWSWQERAAAIVKIKEARPLTE